MADKKISELDPAITPLGGGELVPMDQSGTTVKATVNDIVAASLGADFWEYDIGSGTLEPNPTNVPTLNILHAIGLQQVNWSSDDGGGNTSQLNLQLDTFELASHDATKDNVITTQTSVLRIISEAAGAASFGKLETGYAGTFLLEANDGAITSKVERSGTDFRLTASDNSAPTTNFATLALDTGGASDLIMECETTPYSATVVLSSSSDGSLLIGMNDGTHNPIITMSAIGNNLLYTNLNSVPADGDLAHHAFGLWLDDSTLQTKLMIKAKNGAGTVFTRNLDLGLTDSHTATVAFGSLTLGTPKQNTLGYDILVNISIPITAATAGSLKLGVGSSATPTTDSVTPAVTGAVAAINLVAYVPNTYYLSVATSGTITAGTPVLVATVA